MSADQRRYFEGGISSVYLWDMDDGFAGCVLLKKGMSSLLFTLEAHSNMNSCQPHTTQLR